MQKILKGINNLGEVLQGSTKVLLVCDSSFPFLCIKDDIERMGVPYEVFDQFTPNPLYEDVCMGVELFQSAGCDTILAVGGGSSLDVAKCIKLYCQMERDRLYLEQEYRDTFVKLIAIPTTAGTGSESTRYAVIYYDGKKQSVTHDSIIPDVAILEPKVLKTLPMYQKKCTMMDALCQGIESWWSVNSNEKSKKLSKEAVAIIMQWWREYIFENTAVSAEAIMNAANLAGQAICITQTTAPHAFSYKLTSMFGLPHGHAVAICLPEIWEYMVAHSDQCVDQRGEIYLKTVFTDIANAMSCTSSFEAIQRFRSMLDELQIGLLHSEDIINNVKVLAQSVNPIRLKNNPVRLSEEVIEMIYKQLMN